MEEKQKCKVCGNEWKPHPKANLCCATCGCSMLDCTMWPDKAKKWKQSWDKKLKKWKQSWDKKHKKKIPEHPRLSDQDLEGIKNDIIKKCLES